MNVILLWTVSVVLVHSVLGHTVPSSGLNLKKTFIFPRLKYNQYFFSLGFRVKQTLFWNAVEETFVFSEEIRHMTDSARFLADWSADSKSYRQTSRRHTSPSHPQCRPLSAPARLRCVADSCTRPGTCRWQTSRVEISASEWKAPGNCQQKQKTQRKWGWCEQRRLTGLLHLGGHPARVAVRRTDRQTDNNQHVEQKKMFFKGPILRFHFVSIFWH